MDRIVKLVALFVLGAFIGTVADRIHVEAGVLSYPHPAPLDRQAIWVPLVFGAGGLLLVVGHALLMGVTREQAPRASRTALASSLVWFFGAYASTAVFRDAPLRLTLALAVAWVARMAFSPTRERALAGPVYAIAGSLFESALSATGAFRYAHPDLLLVPAWLPALYLHVSLMTHEAYLAFFSGARAR